jgi:hypothetical protein
MSRHPNACSKTLKDICVMIKYIELSYNLKKLCSKICACNKMVKKGLTSGYIIGAERTLLFGILKMNELPLSNACNIMQ